MHPDYDGSPTCGHDIALIKLSKEASDTWLRLHGKKMYRMIDFSGEAEKWNNENTLDKVSVGGYPVLHWKPDG